MFVIHDEGLIKQLEAIAEQEKRPIEDVLKALVARYPVNVTPTEQHDSSEAVRRVRQKAYSKARAYWQSVGEDEKAAMTNVELDEQFGAFDEEGIPRLKSELKSLEPPVGSLAYAAKIIRETGGVRTGGSINAAEADDILNEEFADYLLKRMKRTGDTGE